MHHSDESDPPIELPGAAPWLISCDESGMGGEKFYGFGSIWMDWHRRGDFSAGVQAIAARHAIKVGTVDGVAHEFKWTKVKAQKLGFYREIVEYFFRQPRLWFHCIIVRRSDVQLDRHDGGYDEAKQKHLTMLLTNKISRALARNRKRKFRVWLDPLPFRSKKAHEAIHVISNHVLNQRFGKLQPVDRIIEHESHDTVSIQLCDLLLGAVMSAWQGDVAATAKLELQHWIAEHLGWTDLRADTQVDERKFNIWFFYDPTLGSRGVKTRPVQLRYPLPPSTG